MVREEGLEPTRREALVPKTSVSTNSTTRASPMRAKLFSLFRKNLQLKVLQKIFMNSHLPGKLWVKCRRQNISRLN